MEQNGCYVKMKNTLDAPTERRTPPIPTIPSCHRYADRPAGQNARPQGLGGAALQILDTGGKAVLPEPPPILR